MKSLYLLINLFTILFPVLLSFDKRVRFVRQWRFIFPGMLLVGIFFLAWDAWFTAKGVWSFNEDYVLGFKILELPLEEILFFITVPFACIFIYECLNHYLQKELPEKVVLFISRMLFALSLVMLALYPDRIYTLVTFGILLLLMGFVLFAGKPRFLGRFYVAFAVSLIPFYLVNGMLTAFPVVLYNDAENLGFRVGTIPFEDHFYSFCLLLMNVLVYEKFKSRAHGLQPAS